MFGQSRPIDYVKEDLREYLGTTRKHPDERSLQRHLKGYLEGMNYAWKVEKDFFPPKQDIPNGYDYRSELDLEVVTSRDFRNIAIELKHDFGGASERDRLERQLRDYSQVWNYIVVCSQGIQRPRDWNRVANQFQTSGGMFGNGQEIIFISDNSGGTPNRRTPDRQQNTGSMNPFDNVYNPFDNF